MIDLDQDCSSLTVSIFDSEGELVKSIDAEDLEAGTNTFQWDGTDEDGSEVEDGVYTYTVASTDTSGPTITTYGTYAVEGRGERRRRHRLDRRKRDQDRVRGCLQSHGGPERFLMRAPALFPPGIHPRRQEV